MPNFRLSRRAVLRGAGTVAIALPWLEIMGDERHAAAAPTPAKRFLAVYTPGGTVLDKWRPTGTETSPILSPILQPLQPVFKDVIVVDGLDMKCAVGEQYQAGIIGWLTGTEQTNAVLMSYFGNGPSIDQVLAGRISATKRKKSLQFAIRWGTGKAHGRPWPTDITCFADGAGFSPIPPQLDPVAIWQDLFGTLPNADPRQAWDKSILDSVMRRYQTLAPRLGASDKRKMDAHLQGLRDLEQQLATTKGNCTAPTLVDTSDYNPASGLNSADNGSIKDIPTDAAMPKVGKLMTDMLVMAMACDMTAVGTLQWSDTEAKYTLPWLGLTEHHMFYQNDGGYHPAELERIYTWYSQQHAYLIGQMAKVDMGGHTLLDESVVFFGSEIQHPATHSKVDMPFLLAGHGGGLRTGRWARYIHEPHNNLLLSICNLFGDPRTTFGDPKYCTGPLGNLY